MKTSGVKGIASIGVLALSLGASGLAASNAGASGTTTTTVKVPNLSNVTLSIGDISQQLFLPLVTSGEITSIGNGLYSAKGYSFKLKFTQFVAGPEALAGIVGNSIDLAVTADTPAIFAQAQGVKFKVVAATLPALPGADFSIVLPKGSTITSLAQLQGKTISAQTGTINEYFAIEALKSAGLAANAVTIDNLTPTNALAALASGAVAAAVLPEPYVSLERLSGDTVLTTANGFINGYQFLDAAQNSLKSAAKSAAIGDVIKLLSASQAWTSTHLTSFTATVASTYSLPTSLASALLTNTISSFVQLDSKVINSTQSEANVFLQQGELSAAVTVKKAFDTRYNAIIAALKV